MVVDEYGTVEGIVTLTDIVQILIGGTVTLNKDEDPYITIKEDKSIVVLGNTPIEEVLEILEEEHLPDDEEEQYRTIASFVLKQLGRIPKQYDSFMSIGHKFTVLEMEGFRISKILIQKNIEL